MNIYEVTIDPGEMWVVAAATVQSAIRGAIRFENEDRREGEYCRLDKEATQHGKIITFAVALIVKDATQEEIDKYFGGGDEST
jgi:hypothetical protein